MDREQFFLVSDKNLRHNDTILGSLVGQALAEKRFLSGLPETPIHKPEPFPK